MTISLNAGYHKGYGRKGAALHAMKRYDHAVAAYKEGLKVCPNQEHLKLGLAAAKRARVDSSKANKAARRTVTTQKAKMSRARKAKKAPTVSQFVQQTRAELTLQMAAIQAQLDLINELAAMTDEGKLDLLFNLIDKDGDGTVDATELAAALRKRNTELSFSDSLERAISMVAAFDTDGDAKLDTEEFAVFIEAMLKELGLVFNEFSEFLVLQLLFSEADQAENMPDAPSKEEINEMVKAQELLLDMLQDPRLVELFKLFDKDGDRELSVAELTLGLYPMMPNLDKAARVTMEALLTMDKEDSRELNFGQFGRLMLAVVAAANTTFDEVADDLALFLVQDRKISERAKARLMIEDEHYKAVRSLHKKFGEKVSPNLDALAYGRLQKLFDLWDENGDGDISFEELTQGLQLFQKAVGTDDAEGHAEALLGFDTDGDQALGRNEFAMAMAHYAKIFGVNLHELIDFMCVTTALGDERTKGYQVAFRQSVMGDGNVEVKPVCMEYYEERDDNDFMGE